MSQGLWDAVEAAIRSATDGAFRVTERTPLAGDGGAGVYRIAGPGARYVVKTAQIDTGADFAAEAEGLEALAQAHGLRVPQVVAQGAAGSRAFLVLEHVALQPLDDPAAAALGEALADLHGIAAARYGWHRDNRIGPTLQRNAPTGDWALFWGENRLGYQIELAAGRGDLRLARAGEQLIDRLPELLAGHCPEASLVHGDLWRGNVAMDDTGRPVLFDPAVYHGDRETDLAMAELFGGLSPVFFEAYHGAWPLPRGYRESRRDLYQLYHLFNHAALFGGHYAEESLRVIQGLL